jgi:hypothetical protein
VDLAKTTLSLPVYAVIDKPIWHLHAGRGDGRPADGWHVCWRALPADRGKEKIGAAFVPPPTQPSRLPWSHFSPPAARSLGGYSLGRP